MGESLKPGTLLNWFRIESILGRGGFGTTYLATDTNLKTQVAIKEFLPSEITTRVLGDEVMPRTEHDQQMYRWGLDRFLEEARILAQFKHRNIVRVLTVFESNNTAYMVMEYEQGSNLAALAREPAYRSEARLKSLFGQILAGLAEVHRKDIIHRDIKPANIYVREDGSPVLLDFGSARQSVAGQQKTMTRLMTKGYAPYEQIDEVGGVQGPWTDIYSIGATLYYIIANELPADSLSRFTRVIQKRPDPLIPLRKKVQPGLYTRTFLDAIDQALAFEPHDRPQSIEAFMPQLLGERAAAMPVAAPSSEDATVIDPVALNTDPFVRSARRREAAMVLDTTGEPSQEVISRPSAPIAQEPRRETRPVAASVTADPSVVPPTPTPVPAPRKARTEPRAADQVESGAEDFRPRRRSTARRRFPWWALGSLLIVLGLAGGAFQLYESGQWATLTGIAAKDTLESQRLEAEKEQARQAAIAAQAESEAERRQAESDAARAAEKQAAERAAAERARQAELEAERREAARREAQARREAEAEAERLAAARREEERAAAAAAAERAEQVAKAEAERQATLARQREEARQAELAAETAAREQAAQQAQIAEEQARAVAEAEEASRRALEQETRIQQLDEQGGKSGLEMLNVRLTEFAEALKRLDANRLLQTSEPSQRSRAVLTGISDRYQRADISISGVTVSEARGVARAVVSLNRVYRADGQYVIPGDDWRSFDLTMNREGGIWSRLRW